MTTIAYLGPPGTFSEEAAIAYGGPDAEFLPLASMPAAVTAVETGLANVCVLPIENVLEGSVTTTLDLLIHETDLHIAGETVIPIRHYLITRPGLALGQIKLLYAHPQSLGQCRNFVERCLPGVATVAALSNSVAPAEALADERPAAAISPLRIAKSLGAQFLAHDIQDRRDNVTRFIGLGRAESSPTGDDKTSMLLRLRRGSRRHLVGDASRAGEREHQHDQAQIAPSKAMLGDYIFLVDINGHRAEPQHRRSCWSTFEPRPGCSKCLGSYPCWRPKE